MNKGFFCKEFGGYTEDEFLVHKTFPETKLLYAHRDNMDEVNDWKNAKEKTPLENLIFTTLMVSLGVLSGSALSIPLGLLAGVGGAVVMALFFGGLSILFEKRTNGNGKGNSH